MPGKKRKKRVRMIGEYDLTGTVATVLSKEGGPMRDSEEIVDEMGQRDSEAGIEHGQSPIGMRWTGKAVTEDKREKT